MFSDLKIADEPASNSGTTHRAPDIRPLSSGGVRLERESKCCFKAWRKNDIILLADYSFSVKNDDGREACPALEGGHFPSLCLQYLLLLISNGDAWSRPPSALR